MVKKPPRPEVELAPVKLLSSDFDDQKPRFCYFDVVFARILRIWHLIHVGLA